MSRRSTRKRGGGKVSYSKQGIAKQMGISVNQLQAKLNKAARSGKKHSTHRRALLARMTSTRGIPLSRATRLGIDVSSILPDGATRVRKQTRQHETPKASGSTRRAATAANASMSIPFNAGPLKAYLETLNNLLQNIEANYLNPDLTTQKLREYITAVENDLKSKTRGITEDAYPDLKKYVGQQFGKLQRMRYHLETVIQPQRKAYRMAASMESKGAADELAGMLDGLLKM